MQSRVRLIDRTVALTRLLLVVALIMLGSMVPQMTAAQAVPMAGHDMSQHHSGGNADHGVGHGAGHGAAKSHGLACDIVCIGVTVPGMAALVPGVYLRVFDIRLPIAVARLTGREPAPPMHPPKPDLFG